MSKIPHVLILGGGFGGLSVSNELRKNFDSSKLKITIIDKKDWFMVGFAKLWIMNGTRTFENSTVSLKNLSKKNINFLQDEILRIDFECKTVYTSKNEISYDFLVISMGSTLAPERIPGLIEYGYNLYDYEQLGKIRKKLEEIEFGKIAICITSMPYKCPPAPYEACLLIDSMLRKRGVREKVEISIYCPTPITMPAAGNDVSQQILQMIESESINFHNLSKLKSVEKSKLIFENSETSFDLLLAVPPHIAPKLIYESHLANDPGFIKIDRDCKTKFENVFAIGDVTVLPVTETMNVPKAGVFAEGEGIIVSKNIISKIREEGIVSLYDGIGGCFIESGRNTASMIEVDMFSQEKPITRLTPSTNENLSKKLEFERERLTKWF
jgi:sulfide:quinone oxidoreductase